jgi:hypothetical protein
MARAQPEPGTGDAAREFEHLMREGTRLFGLMFWIFLKINILISNGPRFHAEGTGSRSTRAGRPSRVGACRRPRQSAAGHRR